MNIVQLRLDNFKVFRNAKIDFRPLTVLAGTNSSGKTTILNSILSILQSHDARLFPFGFDPNGKYCSLGSFRSIVNGQNTKQQFGIGLTVQAVPKADEAIGLRLRELRVDVGYRYSSSGNQILLDRFAYQATYPKGEDRANINWRGQSTGYRASISAGYRNQWIKSPSALALANLITEVTESENAAKSKPRQSRTRTPQAPESVFGKQPRAPFTLQSRNPRDLIREFTSQPAGGHILGEIREVLASLTNSLRYIAPVRVSPARHYLFEGTSQPIDFAGRNAIQILSEWKKYFPRRYRQVLHAIQQLELASRLSPESATDETIQLNIRPYGHAETVNFADVGFGVSQVLPILIANVALPKGGTLLINQPEVHLHPSSQALLANIFVAGMRNHRYVIETHSEYLVNRLRLLAVQKRLNVDDVAIVFFDVPPRARQPKIHYITIDKDGSLVDAPKSFFETYYLDTFDLAAGRFS